MMAQIQGSYMRGFVRSSPLRLLLELTDDDQGRSLSRSADLEARVDRLVRRWRVIVVLVISSLMTYQVLRDRPPVSLHNEREREQWAGRQRPPLIRPRAVVSAAAAALCRAVAVGGPAQPGEQQHGMRTRRMRRIRSCSHSPSLEASQPASHGSIG